MTIRVHLHSCIPIKAVMNRAVYSNKYDFRIEKNRMASSRHSVLIGHPVNPRFVATVAQVQPFLAGSWDHRPLFAKQNPRINVLRRPRVHVFSVHPSRPSKRQTRYLRFCRAAGAALLTARPKTCTRGLRFILRYPGQTPRNIKRSSCVWLFSGIQSRRQNTQSIHRAFL